ncbi:MAG: flagellar hook capping family protein [Alphaproteobacteria bacterium]|nr:flagellar hook capping family protein [Alphaproteobacteria bacterium]
MATVPDVSINTAVTQQNKTNTTGLKLAEDFAQFLTLLTIQLQNQDPLSPMDTTEFTNQLVGFAGVEQQINTNQKLDSLVAMNLGNGMGSALNYVGMDISYLSSEFNFDAAPVEISYALDKEAVVSKIRIFNEEGEKVFETDANRTPGTNKFTWDGTLSAGGTAPAGTYEVKIDALDIEGEPIESTTVVSGRVRGVETQNGLLFLLVGERAVSLGNVLNAKQPGSTT